MSSPSFALQADDNCAVGCARTPEPICPNAAEFCTSAESIHLDVVVEDSAAETRASSHTCEDSDASHNPLTSLKLTAPAEGSFSTQEFGGEESAATSRKRQRAAESESACETPVASARPSPHKRCARRPAPPWLVSRTRDTCTAADDDVAVQADIPASTRSVCGTSVAQNTSPSARGIPAAGGLTHSMARAAPAWLRPAGVSAAGVKRARDGAISAHALQDLHAALQKRARVCAAVGGEDGAAFASATRVAAPRQKRPRDSVMQQFLEKLRAARGERAVGDDESESSDGADGETDIHAWLEVDDSADWTPRAWVPRSQAPPPPPPRIEVEEPLTEAHVRLRVGETASVPPILHHTTFFVHNAPRFRKPRPQDVAPDPEDRDVATFRVAEPLTPTQYYQRMVCATEDECLAERGAPQGSAAWLKARSNPLTASQFGAAVGLCPYDDSTPDDVIHDKIWNTFRGNEPTRWGNEHEPHAQEAFERWFLKWLSVRCADAGHTDAETAVKLARVRFLHDNLIRFARTPFLGVSPDGLVDYVDADGSEQLALVEHKCGFAARGSTSGKHPYAAQPPREHEHLGFGRNVPPYYGAQMVGITGYLNMHLGERGAMPRAITRIFFSVWTPLRYFVTLVDPCEEYFRTRLLPQLTRFYFQRLLPALTAKHNGQLTYCASTRRGTIEPNEFLMD